MADKGDLTEWLLHALAELGGSAHHVRIAERIWNTYSTELEHSGDLLYTWQYDLRWAAQKLRDTGWLEKVVGRGNGVWSLARRMEDLSSFDHDWSKAERR